MPSRITLPPPNLASSPGVVRSFSISINKSVSARRTRSPVVGPYKSAYWRRGIFRLIGLLVAFVRARQCRAPTRLQLPPGNTYSYCWKSQAKNLVLQPFSKPPPSSMRSPDPLSNHSGRESWRSLRFQRAAPSWNLPARNALRFPQEYSSAFRTPPRDRTAARDLLRKNENENQPGWAGRPYWRFPIRFSGVLHLRSPGFPPTCIHLESSGAFHFHSLQKNG